MPAFTSKSPTVNRAKEIAAMFRNADLAQALRDIAAREDNRDCGGDFRDCDINGMDE